MRTAGELAAALRGADAARPPGEWIRGVGYHESVAGELDRYRLDELVAGRPVRVQHRSGAAWILNSAALSAAGVDEGAPAGVIRDGAGQPTGWVHRADSWLRGRVGGPAPDLAAVGQRLARYGVTGVTDMTPVDTIDDLAPLEAARRDGTLPCRVVITGSAAVADLVPAGAGRGPVKVIIDDAALPGLDELVSQFQAARRAGRAVATHCVTREALVLALVTWETVGAIEGDRIEHGALVPVELFSTIADLGVTVVTQPIFVAERGDEYLSDVDVDDVGDLWRCRALVDAGIDVSLGTDAPHGDLDPWRSIAAAAARRTPSGRVLGPAERIPAADALAMFLGDAARPSHPRQLTPGAPADVCVLGRPLDAQLADPTSDAVVATIVGGELVWHDR